MHQLDPDGRAARIGRSRLRSADEHDLYPEERYQQRKGQELNLQGVAARPLSKRLPSPVGLPFRITIHCTR